ncbi:hypothetical protein H4R35_000755 [Dimargaris xerosporica]|nr:hypothetical protein H4R35_000755 [Dimargaris xerosporica]
MHSLLLITLAATLWLEVTAKTHRESIRQITRYEFPTNPTVTLYHRRSVNSFDAADLLSQRQYTNATPGPVVTNPPYLGFDDTFQWEFHAFNTTFRFLLEPNHDLIHPEATWSRASLDHAHLPFDRSAIKIYQGHAMTVEMPTGLAQQSPSPSAHLFRHSRQELDSDRNWGQYSLPGDARLIIYDYDQNGQPIFDGSFDVEGATYYVKPIALYEDTRRSDDPTIASPSIRSPAHRDSSMIVYRSTDYAPDTASQSTSALHRRQDPRFSSSIRSQCATAHSEWNRQQTAAAVSHQLANLDRPSYLEVPHDPWLGLARRSELPEQWLRQLRRDTPQAGCPGSTRVVYFGVAADCTYVQAYQTPDKARAQILSNWNQASAVFERQFNVKLGIIELKILDSGCPISPDSKLPWNRGCASNYPIEDRLSDFSQWRGSKGKDSAGLWHLMTNCPTGTEVGIAWLGTLCLTKANQQPGGYTSGTGISAVSREEWQIVAHEVGHNFGAIHDCEASTCPCTSTENCDCCPCSDQCNCDAKYIMNPTSPVKTKDFSPCSIERICSTIGAQGSCLKESGAATVLGEAMCGNGIKEKGEECDCGTPDECENDPCCDGKTCKLAKGAACSDSNDLCCAKCQVKAANTVCRAQYSECDVEEVCDGKSSECPEDKQVEDGTDCGNSTASGLQCANGQCTSRDAQCQARGSPLGIKERCTMNIGADPCDFQCNHPSNGLACIFLSGAFMEGTVCGWHAKCRDGKCKGDNAFYQFALLFQKNLAVSIPIAILVVLVVLGLVSSLCCRCFGRLPIGAGHGRSGGGEWWRSKSATPAADPNAIHMVPTTSHHMYRGTSPSDYTNLDRSDGGAGPYQHSNFVDPTPYNGPNDTHDHRDLLYPAPPSPRYLRS